MKLSITFQQDYGLNRIDWIDVARAITIIFVYLGHWSTARITSFAYAFHLQLFFIISGFFAIKQQKYTWKKFILKQINSFVIPLFIWAWISLVISCWDTEVFFINKFKILFLDPASIQPNYWFIPAILGVSIAYYLLLRVFHSGGVVCIIFLILHIFYGENAVVNSKYNIFYILSQLPLLKIINGWVSIRAVPQFGFWYAFGAICFPYICKCFKWKEEKERRELYFHGFGFLITFLTSILFLYRITEFEIISKFIYYNNLTLLIYKDICTVIICSCILYLSTFLEKSKLLKEIGKSTLVFMGLEFLTHGYITLVFLPMINLGIPNIVSTSGVITVTIGQFLINIVLAFYINRHFPILNGKIGKRKEPKNTSI